MRYIGKGEWLPGIPARDLTEEEVIQFGDVEELVGSGLWEEDDGRRTVDDAEAENEISATDEHG